MDCAIIGCGAISRSHLDAVLRLEGVRLTSVCDIKRDRAAALASEAGGEIAVYDDYRALIERERPDVVHICTPHNLHVPMAAEALKKGIHVVMEKPSAMNEAELSRLSEYQGAAKIGVCFQNRYNKSVIRAKELIESGEAGRVVGARAFMTWNRAGAYYTESGWRGTLEKEGGGVLMNQSIHTADLLVHLIGKPVSVSATVANHHQKNIIEVEDTAEAYIQFENGATACFYATNAFVRSWPVMIDIVCEKASIRLEEQNIKIIWSDGRIEENNYDAIVTGGKARWGAGHRALITHFYDCVRKNLPFGIDYDSAAVTMRLVFGIYHSAAAGDAYLL